MKISFYNEYFTIYNSYCVFNTKNNNFVFVDEDTYNNLKNNKVDFINDKSNLVSKGIIVDENCDELGELEKIFNKDKNSKNLLDITISVTSNCNFCCYYCYEKHENKFLTKENAEHIIEFIGAKLKENYKELLITWYGGEPLLCFDLIYYMQEKIANMCKKSRTRYSSYLTTNGYLLNEKIISKLKNMKLNDVCVTLDGTKELHDKRRVLKNGEGTFDKIVSNVQLLKKNKIPCSIRMNVDRENEGNVNELKNFVSENLEIPFYLAQVSNVSKECKKSEEYLSSKQFSFLYYNFTKDKRSCPKILYTHCRGSRVSNYIIDNNLNIYSCAFGIGTKECMRGNLKVDILNQNDYLNWNPFTFEKCRKCRALSYCMGGCVLKGLQNKEPVCEHIIYTYKDIIKDYIESVVLKDKVVKLKSSVRFRKEKDCVFMCDCKNLFDFTLPYEYYEFLTKLKEGLVIDFLNKDEKDVVKDLKNLNLLDDDSVENKSNVISRIQYNESEFYK